MAGQPAGGTPPTQPLKDVKRVIAVGAGKGGVGKSTVAINLALALKETGATVGVLDGDVYGPSIPKMLGTNERPSGSGPNDIHPIEAFGLKLMSMGFLLDPAKPMVVRGPIVHTVIRQFLGDVAWGSLDWLIVDLPPGTGDVALSLAQSTQLTGAVVVSTPQDVALIDVHKAVSMFRSLKVPVVGMVENMSGYVCPKCEHHDDIFGRGGAEAWAAGEHIPFLGAVPLHRSVAVGGDAGTPALADPNTPEAIRAAFQSAAKALSTGIDEMLKQGPPAPLIQIDGLK